MRVAYVVTLDAPDVPNAEVTAQQIETARAVIHRAVCKEVPHGVHVTTTEQRGLPLHPFNVRPFPKP